eukprot:1182786-Prorocentrum_minimum.AAC.1
MTTSREAHLEGGGRRLLQQLRAVAVDDAHRHQRRRLLRASWRPPAGPAGRERLVRLQPPGGEGRVAVCRQRRVSPPRHLDRHAGGTAIRMRVSSKPGGTQARARRGCETESRHPPNVPKCTRPKYISCWALGLRLSLRLQPAVRPVLTGSPVGGRQRLKFCGSSNR